MQYIAILRRFDEEKYWIGLLSQLITLLKHHSQTTRQHNTYTHRTQSREGESSSINRPLLIKKNLNKAVMKAYNELDKVFKDCVPSNKKCSTVRING